MRDIAARKEERKLQMLSRKIERQTLTDLDETSLKRPDAGRGVRHQRCRQKRGDELSGGHSPA